MKGLMLAAACAALWACATPAAPPAPAPVPPGPASIPGVELRGEWQQGGLIRGRAPPGTRLTWGGRAVRVSPQGLFVFGLDRDEPAQGELVVTLPDGTVERRTAAVQARNYRIQRIDGLPPDKVTPPPAALARIRQDVAQTRAARARDTARTDFAQDFVWPSLGPISGVFGSQRILNGVPKQPHYGVDVAAPVGTKVHAPAGGVVSLAVPDMYYTGGTVMIDHGHGVTSTLMHLSKLHVKAGQEVKQGDLVAEVGATGRVTGPHLDWRISWFDARVDPQLLVGPMPPP